MLSVINALVPAQLQPGRMQGKAQWSQHKQSQQHPHTAGGNAERAKDAPAELPGPGLPGGMDMPWYHGPRAGIQQHPAATMGSELPWVDPRVPGLLPGTQICGTEVPEPCSGSAEPQWVAAELQLVWDP